MREQGYFSPNSGLICIFHLHNGLKYSYLKFGDGDGTNFYKVKKVDVLEILSFRKIKNKHPPAQWAETHLSTAQWTELHLSPVQWAEIHISPSLCSELHSLLTQWVKLHLSAAQWAEIHLSPSH